MRLAKYVGRSHPQPLPDGRIMVPESVHEVDEENDEVKAMFANGSLIDAAPDEDPPRADLEARAKELGVEGIARKNIPALKEAIEEAEEKARREADENDDDDEEDDS